MIYTDEQIKEELQRILKIGDAPIGVHWGCSLNKQVVSDTLDLINLQEAEKAELQREIANCNAKIKALKMDNEQLQTDNFNANMDLEDLQAEIERLSAENGQLGNDVDVKLEYVYELEERIKTAKSEAIEECTKKLKSIFGEWIFSYKTEDLFKETVGESK